MNIQLFSRELFKWVMGGLQLLSMALGGGKLTGVIDWLSGHEATIFLLLSGAIGLIQTFVNKPKVPVKVVANMFALTCVLTGLLLFTGCARLHAILRDVPAVTVVTERGDRVEHHPDGSTTIIVAPIRLPPPPPVTSKTYSLEK